jgi:hypothetical protein
MPVIHKLLDELSDTKCFSKFDLWAGYQQICMDEANEFNTAFKIHQRHYQFHVMYFGLTNGLATFQCLMGFVPSLFLSKFVLVFLDDILV